MARGLIRAACDNSQEAAVITDTDCRGFCCDTQYTPLSPDTLSVLSLSRIGHHSCCLLYCFVFLRTTSSKAFLNSIGMDIFPNMSVGASALVDDFSENVPTSLGVVRGSLAGNVYRMHMLAHFTHSVAVLVA